MQTRIRSRCLLVAVASAAVAVSSCASEQPGVSAVELDADGIGGVVSSAVGSEAGVWVIAETDDLPTLFVRIREVAGGRSLHRCGPIRQPPSGVVDQYFLDRFVRDAEVTELRHELEQDCREAVSPIGLDLRRVRKI